MPPVNTLSNVNISLQQFQDISCGKFNAGEVRLRSANGLDKMNDHVDRRGLNQETISHAEVIAIKQSLVKALSQHGVAQDEIDRVRKDLGLAATGPTDRSLRFRSVMPLSRQKVREILDRYGRHANNLAPAPVHFCSPDPVHFCSPASSFLFEVVHFAPLRRLQSRQSIWQFSGTVRPPSRHGVT